MCRIETLALALLVLNATVPTQAPFARLAKTHLPENDGATYSVSLGDVDGDGDLDILTATWRGRNRLYLNDGGGIFRDATSQIPQAWVASRKPIFLTTKSPSVEPTNTLHGAPSDP